MTGEDRGSPKRRTAEDSVGDMCAQAERCRYDPRCPFVDSCARHVHGPDCGGCLE